MAAARAEEGEPPQGSFTLAVRTLTGDKTTLEDVLSSQTVGSVTVFVMTAKVSQRRPGGTTPPAMTPSWSGRKDWDNGSQVDLHTQTTQFRRALKDTTRAYALAC